MLKLSPPENILIIRLSAIGDTCHALAVVRAIQDYWPESRITWIIGKTEAGLMADIPDIEFIIFDKSKGRGGYRDVERQLNNRRFDVALCMHASMRANRLCRIVNADLRIGYDIRRARDFQWLFTDHRIPAVHGEHVQDAMMGFAREISVEPGKLRWDIPLADAERQFARRQREAERPFLLISPCSSQRSRNFRNWSAENYAATADYVQQRYDCTVVLSGGSSSLERDYAETIGRCAEADIINLVGQTDLKQLLALIAESDVLVCPDSGPAHMATTVGTPVIGLYATSNPARSGPYLSTRLTINAYPEAVLRFLGKRADQVRFGTRVRNPGAMELVSLQSVKDSIDQALL